MSSVVLGKTCWTTSKFLMENLPKNNTILFEFVCTLQNFICTFQSIACFKIFPLMIRYFLFISLSAKPKRLDMRHMSVIITWKIEFSLTCFEFPLQKLHYQKKSHWIEIYCGWKFIWCSSNETRRLFCGKHSVEKLSAMESWWNYYLKWLIFPRNLFLPSALLPHVHQCSLPLETFAFAVFAVV